MGLTTADIGQISRNIQYTIAPLFYGTEFGNILYKNGKKLSTMAASMTAPRTGRREVPEEEIRKHGFDKVVTETLEALKEEKKKGIYKKGSIQDVSLDYMIWEHENMLKRTSYKNNEHMRENSAYRAVSKWANTRTVPKLSAEQLEIEGVDPDFKADVMGNGIYTLEEIDKSFQSSNMNNFILSGIKYIDTVNQISDLMKAGEIKNEELLRQQIIDDGEKLVAETNKIIENVKNPKDNDTLKIFDDGKLTGDFAIEGDRSLSHDIKSISKDIEYLKEELPLEGFVVYKDIDNSLSIVENRINTLGAFRGLSNINGLKQSLKDLRVMMDSMQDASDDMLSPIWYSEIGRRIESIQKEYTKLVENPKFNKDQNGQEISQEKKNSIINDIKKDTDLLNNLEKLQKHRLTENQYFKREGVREHKNRSKEFIDDLENQRIKIGEELTQLKKEIKNMPEKLKNAVDNAISECDPKTPGSLKSLQESMKKLHKEAKKYEPSDAQDKEAEKLALYNKIKDNFKMVVRGCKCKQIYDYIDPYTRSKCAEINREEMKQTLQAFKDNKIVGDSIKPHLDNVIKAIDTNADAEKFADAVATFRQQVFDEYTLITDSALDEDQDAIDYIEKYNRDYNVDVNKAKTQDKKAKLAEYMSNTMPFVNAKVKDALDKGVIYTDSLKKQAELANREERDQLKWALEKFNTKRSGIFGKGDHYSKEYGNESNEHYNLRIAAQKLSAEKSKLSKISMEENPEGWKKQAEIVYSKAVDVMSTGKTYLEKVGYAANTGAGFSRMEGAMDLRHEASLISTQIKKELNAANMYTKYAQKVQEQKAAEAQNAKEAGAKVRSFKEIEKEVRPENGKKEIDEAKSIKRSATQKDMSKKAPQLV